MSLAPNISDFDPSSAPWILPSWRDRIVIQTEPARSRYYGIELVGPCVLWTGWSNGKGHGVVQIEGLRWYLHRWAFACHHDVDLSPGDVIDHLCRNRACFNPKHLESVTPLENFERGDGPLHLFKAHERDRLTRELPF